MKERELTVSYIQLSEISNYVGDTVIVPAHITATGSYDKMKLDAYAHLSGWIISVSGPVKGSVFSEEASFRIGNSEGTSVDTRLDYLNPELTSKLPLQLRTYSPITRTVSVADNNSLVNFLSQAQIDNTTLNFLGRLDSTGKFFVEAVANPQTKEAYALAVYQQK